MRQGGRLAPGFELATGELLAQNEGAAFIEADKVFLPMSIPRMCTAGAPPSIPAKSTTSLATKSFPPEARLFLRSGTKWPLSPSALRASAFRRAHRAPGRNRAIELLQCRMGLDVRQALATGNC